MLPTEVVVSEVQCQGSFIALPLLRESIAESGHTADECSHVEVVMPPSHLSLLGKL